MQTDTDTRDPALASPLAALRDEMASFNTPPAVASELMAAFARGQHRPRRWFQPFSSARWGITGGAALAALLAIAVALPLAVDAPRPHAGVEFAASGIDAGGDFIALASFERIELDPAPRLVEATVPRTSLASLGVPVSPENAGDLVLAEMLVGADGRPLALRLALQ
jgi:hypothetical protein